MFIPLEDLRPSNGVKLTVAGIIGKFPVVREFFEESTVYVGGKSEKRKGTKRKTREP